MILEVALLSSGAIYIADRVDRWWRGRSEQPPPEPPAPTPQAADEPRGEGQLVVTSAALVLAGAAHLAFPPLLPFAAAFVFVGLGDYAVAAKQEWREEARVGSAFLEFLTYGAALLGGYVGTSALMLLASEVSATVARQAERRAHNELSTALSGHPSTAWVLHDEAELELPVTAVAIGDVVLIDAGAVIPFDGVIVRGRARIDERSLTGESWPADKSIGDPVLATCAVLSGFIHVRVERSVEQSVAARTLDVLAQTRGYRAAVRARGQRVADAGALPTMALSGVTLPLLGPVPALAILFAAFGESMRYSGPLTALTYLRGAAALGADVKDGRALEALAEVDLVVFDKTGTLTEGSFDVSQVACFGELGADALLALAAAAETGQEHPIAAAITEACHRRGIDVTAPFEGEVELGLGVRGKSRERRVTLGSAALLALDGVLLPATAATWLNEQADPVGSHVYVSVDGECVGIIELTPRLRASAPALVQRLRALGVRVELLSGDRSSATAALARHLDVDGFQAEVRPSDKAARITALRAEGRRVCFVGDGINDGPALIAADVGISLLGATQVAIDAAGVVVDRDLAALAPLFELARAFDRDLKIAAGLSLLPGVVTVAGVYTLGFGVGATAIVCNASLALALTNAMRPALRRMAAQPETPALTASTFDARARGQREHRG